MNAYCLADFFNLDLWPTGRPPTYPDVRDGVWDLAGAALSAVPFATEVTIRLYGGWHGNLPESRVHLRPMVGRAIDSLPKRRGNQRLRIQIADHPIWDSSMLMLRSVRDGPVARIRASVAPAHDCTLRSTCSIAALRAWARGSCPHSECSVQLREVARVTRQKMVDTLLTVDAVAIGRDRGVGAIAIATDDDDLIPAFLALLTSDVRLVHLTRRQPGRTAGTDYYPRILESAGVHILNW